MRKIKSLKITAILAGWIEKEHTNKKSEFLLETNGDETANNYSDILLEMVS